MKCKFMKKLIGSFVILVCWCSAQCQSIDTLTYVPKLRIGVNAGVAYTYLTTSNKLSMINYFNERIITPQVGISVNINMNKYITFSSGINVVSRSTKATPTVFLSKYSGVDPFSLQPIPESKAFTTYGENGVSNFISVEVPVQMCAKFINRKTFSMGIEVGIWAGILQKGETKYDQRLVYKFRADEVSQIDPGEYSRRPFGILFGLTTVYKNVGLKLLYNEMQNDNQITIFNKSPSIVFQYFFYGKVNN